MKMKKMFCRAIAVAFALVMTAAFTACEDAEREFSEQRYYYPSLSSHIAATFKDSTGQYTLYFFHKPQDTEGPEQKCWEIDSGDSEGAYTEYYGDYSNLPTGDGTLKLANQYLVCGDFYNAHYFDSDKANDTTATKDITIANGSFEIVFPDSQRKFVFTRQ